MTDYGRVNGRVNELISRRINERLIEEIKEEARQKLYEVVTVIKDFPGLKTRDLAKRFGMSERTMARHLKILKNYGIARFEGAPKTGGYVLNSDFLEYIDKNQISSEE